MLASTDGIAPTGVKFLGVGALTDELLVVASDALERAADAVLGDRPTGKLLERCLARLLAAALGSNVSLDDAKAGRPGKRLAQQARKVRDRGVAAASLAQQQREVARAAAAADASLADGLPAQIAEIDAAEAAALAAPRQEVYNNFPEIAPQPPAAEELPPAAAPAAVEPTPDESRWPRWLTRQVGRKGCAYLGSVEEKQRQVRQEYELEYGDEAPDVPLLDWSKKASPRELFLLKLVMELRSELKVEQRCNTDAQKVFTETIDGVVDRNNTEELVLRIEEQELELKRDRAKNPLPVWVCACERVLDDECVLCQDGHHTF